MWEDLNDEERAAVMLLGWDAKAWNDGDDTAPFERDWQLGLSAEQRKAAEALGLIADDFKEK